MEWKYKMIFLLILLCLFCSKESCSQNCITMRYDNNGNRVSLSVHECGSEYKKDEKRSLVNKEVSVNEAVGDVLVYPNPNNGVFNVIHPSIGNEEEPICIQIYNNNGIMIKNENLGAGGQINITNNPSGVYLLRIIQGEKVCGKIIVKL